MQQSAPFARSGGAGIASNLKVVAAAFTDKVLKDGENSEVIEVNDKHLVVLRLREHTPEKQRPLGQVKAQITAQLKKDKAKLRAEEVADALLTRLAKGEDPRVLAKEAKAEWRRVANAARDGSELPPAVALQRTLPAGRIRTPRADVRVVAGSPAHPIGIFGRYHSLSLEFNQPVANWVLWAQDLAGNEAADISNEVQRRTNTLILAGGLIDRIGLSAAAPGDLSEPGLVLVIERPDSKHRDPAPRRNAQTLGYETGINNITTEPCYELLACQSSDCFI